MRTIQNHEMIEELIQYPFVIIVYSRASCGPCTAIKHRLEYFAKEHDVHIFEVPLEDFPAVAAQRNILSAPTIEGYVEGRMYLKESGYFSLDAFLKRYDELMGLERKGDVQ
jgi:thiol-disulfide isomerase/thioredoxin